MHRDQCDELLGPFVMLFICRYHLVFQRDNARPHVARICTQFLEDEIVPVLPWPAYSPDMSPVEHVRDAPDRHVWQRVPISTYIQQLHTAIGGEWHNIPHAPINSLINSMWRRCIALHEANGHTRYWLVFWSKPLLLYTIYTQVCGHAFKWVDSAISATPIADRLIKSSTQSCNLHKQTLTAEWPYRRAQWLSKWHCHRMPHFQQVSMSNFCPGQL
jgi:hypothetical protein